MIRVKFSVGENAVYGGFTTDGHSGYSEEGSDILCAAVSGATELVINILEQFSVDIILDVDESKPHVGCLVEKNEANAGKASQIKCVLDGYYGYIKDLAEEYPEYIQITTEV